MKAVGRALSSDCHGLKGRLSNPPKRQAGNRFEQGLGESRLLLMGAVVWSMPLVAGLVGWSTNWLAIQMSFYPVRFIGIPPWLGWQGVIPRKSRKMADICVDRILERFGDLNDIYRRLEPARIAGQIIAQVAPRLEEYIDEIMYELQPVLWDNLPAIAKRRIYKWAAGQFPDRVQALVDDFGDDFGDLVDLKVLLGRELDTHPDLMNRIFREAGGPEIRFVIISGGVIGALLGVGAMPFNGLLHDAWALPLCGFVVGFCTNWLALNLIFRPLQPRRIFGLRLQGLFLQRQAEIADVWSRLVAQELFTVEKVAYAMLHGTQGARTRAIIQRNLRPLLDQSVIMKLVAQVTVGVSGYSELKKAMNAKAIHATADVFHDADFNRDRAEVVAMAISEQMKALSAREFQDVLRPAFQEEEWQLMVAGGVLGAIAGLLQWVFILYG